jgi:hypothetical protein
LFQVLAYVVPINCLVAESPKERFSCFGQEHELLDTIGASIVFEPGDELSPQATPLVGWFYSQRAEQGARIEAL